MSEFKPCASPSCTACQEVRRLRERIEALLAEHETPPLQEIHPSRLRAVLEDQ